MSRGGARGGATRRRQLDPPLSTGCDSRVALLEAGATCAYARPARPCLRPADCRPRVADRDTRPRDGRGGFTLIEMMAVLVILGIIATVVTVNWNAILPKAELHAAVREISSTLSGTRSEAIARNALFQVQYDIENHRYRVVTPYRNDGGLAIADEDRRALAWTALPKSVRFQTITIDGKEYSRGIVFVRFDGLGSASGHSIVLVQMPFENRYTIEVQGLLGLIDYYEGVHARQPPKEGDFR